MNKEEPMILKQMRPDSEANQPNNYFDDLRRKNYEASFGEVQNFISENMKKPRRRRPGKPLYKWQWMLLVFFPVLAILACTKTESIEPVGYAVSFSVPNNEDAARRELEGLTGKVQTVILPDRQKPGYLSYNCFIPFEKSRSEDAVINQFKSVKGITGLSIVPVNSNIRESLLSRLGYKIFSMHIDATAMDDAGLQNTVMHQLRAKGFNNISVSVVRNEKGVRTLELHPAQDASNYLIDMSLDDNGTRMVLQEERRTNSGSTSGSSPQVDYGRMTDAQVREHVRHQFGKQWPDEKINITRTSDEITISIKETDKKEEVMRFRLK